MAKSIRGIKKSRGRPRTTGPGVQIGIRWQAAELAAIDAWRRHEDGKLSRADAIRRLVEDALGASAALRPASGKQRAKAAEMAGQAIGSLGDQTAAVEERAQRKRRLIKGPREFRDVRGDQLKRKS
jgi:hypothetical protein